MTMKSNKSLIYLQQGKNVSKKVRVRRAMDGLTPHSHFCRRTLEKFSLSWFSPSPVFSIKTKSAIIWVAKMNSKRSINKTSQELRMLSTVTLNCQVTMIVTDSGYKEKKRRLAIDWILHRRIRATDTSPPYIYICIYSGKRN